MMVFNDTLLKAISWTLVHSVWQGFALALLAGLVILATKKSASVMRYHLLSVLFVVFLVVSGLTFYYELGQQQQQALSQLNLPLFRPELSGTSNTGIIDYGLIASDFLNRYSHFIVMGWFFVFVFKVLQICNGFGQIYRIRNYKTYAPSEYWSARISELAQLIGLQKPVVLLESALVKIPSVSGFFKPIVLVPIGMLSGFPHDQVEAILLHELAHIRRKDYVINILQRLAETIFFFNPGLLWLSSLMRDERENCCDDIAVEVIGNKSGFVHALVSFGQYQLQQEQLVMGLGADKSHLFHRAKRIIHNNNKSLNAVEKTFLSVSLLLIAVIMIACAKGKTEAAPTEEPVAPTEANRLVQRANAAADEMVAKANREADELAEVASQDANEQITMQEQIDFEDARQRLAEAKRIEAEAEFHYHEAQRMRLQAEADQKQFKNSKMVGVAPIQTAPVSVATNKPTDKTVSKTVSKRMYERDETTYDSDDPTFRKKIYLRSEEPSEYFKDASLDDLSVKIISDLMDAKVIATTDDLSYKLSPGSLIVNGVKQPEALHAQLKKKYVKGKSYAICYNFEVSGDLAIDSK